MTEYDHISDDLMELDDLNQLQELMSAWLQSQHVLEMLNASLSDGYDTQARG